MISPSLSGNATDHLGRGFHYVSNRAPRAAESSIARPAASGGGGGGGGATTDSLKISALSAADGVGSGTITCIPVLQIRHTSMARTSYWVGSYKQYDRAVCQGSQCPPSLPVMSLALSAEVLRRAQFIVRQWAGGGGGGGGEGGGGAGEGTRDRATAGANMSTRIGER